MVWIGLIACSDYTLDQKPGSELPADSPATESLPTGTTDDTGTPTDETPGVTVTIPDDEIATEPVYINTSDALYSFDPSTARSTFVANFRPDSQMTDIAIALDGRMYAASYEDLYQVNPTTGTTSFIRTLSDSGTGLTFLADGRLVVAGAGVRVYDPTTWVDDVLVPAGRYYTSGDIIGLPDGYLYWTVSGAGSGDLLVRIDPVTGATVELGSTRIYGVYGLGYAFGALYGFTSGDEVVELSTSSGAAMGWDPAPGSWWGATTNPVLW